MSSVIYPEINLDKHLITEYLQNESVLELATYLRNNFTISLNQSTGRPNPLYVSNNTVEALCFMVTLLAKRLDKTNVSEDYLYLLKEVFKSLRNIAAFDKKLQDAFIKDDCVLQTVKQILITNNDNENLKIVLQFFINIVTNFKEVGIKVWEILKDLFPTLYKNIELSYYLSALIYNIVLLNKSILKDCKTIYNYIINGVENEKNEYYLFLLELLVQDISFMSCYDIFDINQKLIVLTYLQELVVLNDKDFILHNDIVVMLSSQFKSKSECILRTVADNVNTLEPQEILLLLEILSSLSARECYLKQLQKDTSLLINCAFLLRNVHSIGKESENNFTPMQKLSDVTSKNSDVQKNPFFGLKANLIQFLGNAAWKNTANQDQLRELECIPLLLDCCNIDARNPFILQWAIFAVKNLCENNVANQEVIAGLNRRGVVNSSTLQEMGLVLHDDGGNKITLLPYSSNNTTN